MRVLLNQPGFSRFESMLGLGLLAVVILFVIPPLQLGMETEKPVRTIMEAEKLAQAVLDFHTDTGRWPLNGDGQTDMALLVPVGNKARTRKMAAAMNSATQGILMGTMVESESIQSPTDPQVKTWLKELPIDPWNRPFRVVILGDRTGARTADTAPGYPAEPPAGTAIVVISAGPNGLYDTDLAHLWSADLSGRLAQEGQIGTIRTDNSFGGDDLGFVLSRSTLGGY